jgi:hypothetical protein
MLRATSTFIADLTLGNRYFAVHASLRLRSAQVGMFSSMLSSWASVRGRQRVEITWGTRQSTADVLFQVRKYVPVPTISYLSSISELRRHNESHHSRRGVQEWGPLSVGVYRHILGRTREKRYPSLDPIIYQQFLRTARCRQAVW